MPVKLEDSEEDVVTSNNIEDSEDEDIVSVKRHKSSRIKSDDSDEEINQDLQTKNGNEHDNPTQSESNDKDLKNDTSSDDEIFIPSRKVSKSTEKGFHKGQEFSSSTSPISETMEQGRNFKQLFANKDLYDSEDSEDDIHPSRSNIPETEISNSYDAEGSSDEGTKQKKSAEKKSKSSKNRTLEKKSKSTKKNDKKKDVDEIHSETQRLVRQSRVSLPYHKPRQRTLAEFLQRRPSVPTKSIRMSTEELELLAKQVAKRAKEAEDFYKSSSDEEQPTKPETTQEKKFDEPCDDPQSKSTANDNDQIEKGESPKDIEIEGDEICVVKTVSADHDSKTNMCFPDNSSNVEKISTSQTSNENLKVALGDSSSYQVENNDAEISVNSIEKDLQQARSAMNKHCISETGNVSVGCDEVKINSVVPFAYEELDSQDLCLRIDDTEMGEERQVEQNISNAIKKTINSEKDEKMIEEEKPQNRVNEELESQDLCLRIEDSESFDKVIDKKKEKLHSEKQFSESVPKIMTTENYEKTVLHKSAVYSRQSIPLPDEIDSQDLCLRIENSDTLDGVDSENSKKSVQEMCVSKGLESALNEENKNKLLYTNDKLSSVNNSAVDEAVFNESESKNPNFLLHTYKHDLLKGEEKNKISHCEDETLKKSPRKNLINLFSESESGSKDVSSDCIGVNKENAVPKTDSVKVILEGEETRLAFEHDCTSTNGKAKTEDSAGGVEKHKSDFLIPEEFHLESTDDREELIKKKKEHSRQSYDLLQNVKDASSDNENVMNTIQKLRGADDTKNAKLVRTMSLLEERLKSTRKSLKLQKEIPHLKGSPSKVIDLDDTPSTCDINTLKQRFLRHSLPKLSAPQKTSVDVSVVLAEKGLSGEMEVKKEIVTVESETENLLGSREKLLKLKEELQRQIVKEREEEWNRRQSEAKDSHSETCEEKSDCGLFDEDEEISESDNALNSDSENEDDEDDEEEEVDEARTKHKRKKSSCAFVDDEAEVSEDECDESGNSDDDDDDNDDDDNEENKLTLEETSSTKDSNEEVSEIISSNSSLKRMKTIDPFESQEVPGDVRNESVLSSVSMKPAKRAAHPSQSQDTDVELESSLSIPPYQPGGAISQITDPVGEESYIDILPPTLPVLHKEDESTENVFSQFPQTSASYNDLGIQNNTNEADAAEVELLGLCSGKFTSQIPEISQEDMDSESELGVSRKKTQDIKSFENLLLSSKYEEESCSEDAKNDLVSKGEINKEAKKNDSSSANRKKFVILSDDEDEPESKVPKKTQPKLIFSDDEDEIELEISDVESTLEADDEPQEVEYDSEENEIAVKPAAAKDFFENEAELSESEWGSADEDEKDLDDFEEEEGDVENLDQNKLKEQLGKIHMRRVLDEDQQEVRRLQELLLEDGEFHSEGGGRQRQFRWKNLNIADDFQSSKKSDDETVGDDEEEEDESEWRRKRFERETFLEEHRNSLEKEEEPLIDTIKLKFKTPELVPRKTGVIKRGSFLSRSEAALARIAQITKNSGELNLTAPTHSRNFVFAHLSQDAKEEERGTKRKAVKVETPVAKKMRVNVCLLDQIG